jgi:hypothetical protein
MLLDGAAALTDLSRLRCSCWEPPPLNDPQASLWGVVLEIRGDARRR